MADKKLTNGITGRLRRKTAAEKSHPSVMTLMADAEKGESPEDVIRRKCRAMVEHARSVGWSGPPFDPIILASIFRVIVEEVSDVVDGEGCIFSRDGRTVIQYKSGILPERQRFTICHELAHTCFTDVFEFIRNRLPNSLAEKAHKEFEHLCDCGASELLMPLDEFLSQSAGNRITGQLVRGISTNFGASIEATVKRLLDTTDQPCLAVFLTDEAFSTYRAWPGRHRVVWSWSSRALKQFIPQGTLPLQSSVCNECQCGGSDVMGPKKEVWYVFNRPRSFYVEALRLPDVADKPDYPKVLAILHTRKR